MKKIILLISILVFSLGISVFCFAADEPQTYSLTTQYLDNRYVVFPVFYCTDNNIGDYQYDIKCSLGMYDKTDDIIYLAARSESEANFINNFIKYDPRKIIFTSNGSNFNDSRGYRFRANEDMTDKLNLKTDNGALPVALLGFKPNLNNFGLNDLLNKGNWFVVGNNYPFNNNSVWSNLIYYPNGSGRWYNANLKPDDVSDDYNLYTIFFELVDSGNVKYKNLDNYYLEIWTSTDEYPDLIFQKNLKLSNLKYSQGINEQTYSVVDSYLKLFPNTSNFHKNVTNIYIRLRYSDRDIELVSSFMYWTQRERAIEPIPQNSWLSNENLPIHQKPSENLENSLNAGSLQGNYELGDFSALDFVKGAGGLKSLVNGVSVVFSFLPSWIWTMLFFVLGALATIALLKVIIS